MEGRVGDLRARAVRLRRKYGRDVLSVGFCLAGFGGLVAARDGSGDWNLLGDFFFVGPGALAWAVTGRRTYGSWASSLWVLVVVYFGWDWLAAGTSLLTIVGFGPLACFVAVRRAKGWTLRGAFRTRLVRGGQWLGVEVREVEQVAVEAPDGPYTGLEKEMMAMEAVEAMDRPNTGPEREVMALVWVSAVCLGVWLGHESGKFWAAL